MKHHSYYRTATLVVGALLGIVCSNSQASLIVSLLPQDSFPGAFDQQSIDSVPTRTTSGAAETLAPVGGSISIMAGQEVGASGYPGFDLRSFALSAQFTDLNRFGSSERGGLVVWDYDLSAYLAGVNVGTGPGESSFTIDINYDGRRSESIAAEWFISYNGSGLSLDTTDITTIAVSGNSSGTSNNALVTNSSNYKPIVSLSGNTSGSESIDLTSDLASVAAGDGLLRIAYLEGGFLGDINLLGASGIVETANPIPEPSSLFAVTSMVGVFLLRSRRSIS